MRLGYSFWGFLGHGITDTPDGGRSHRRVLVDALAAAGWDLVFLQPDRDLAEAGERIGGPYRWESGLPEIDALFLEWRWPIPGRNTTPCGTPGHTCDLHRQAALVDHYTRGLGVPTLLWDKDRQLPADDPLRTHPHVTVCEAALYPSPGAVSLLFPVADPVLDSARPRVAADPGGLWPLTYVGNQYDRNDVFDRYLATAAAVHRHRVAGKWTDTSRWPHVNFIGRVPFPQVHALYATSLATILLLPDRHLASGTMTQRLPEAVLAGCLPLLPVEFRGGRRLVPEELHVSSGRQAAARIASLARASAGARAELVAACLDRLSAFRVSRQVATVHSVLGAPVSRALPR